jgi:RNA polymerase sigma-70 factor (ECF subfamily)
MIGRVGSFSMKSTDIVAVRDEGVTAPPQTWDRDDFQRAIEPLLPQLFRLCRALSDDAASAEDLMQGALVKAFLHRASYRGSSPLLGWLYGIVRNEQSEVVRTTARRRNLVRVALERFGELWGDFSADGVSGDPESWLLSGESSEHLLAAVRALPETFRSVVWMCDVEEMGHEEVSQVLSVPLGTVKSRHARGRARLRALLEGHSSAAEVKP